MENEKLYIKTSCLQVSSFYYKSDFDLMLNNILRENNSNLWINNYTTPKLYYDGGFLKMKLT